MALNLKEYILTILKVHLIAKLLSIFQRVHRKIFKYFLFYIFIYYTSVHAGLEELQGLNLAQM